jgi:hypothetical protein
MGKTTSRDDNSRANAWYDRIRNSPPAHRALIPPIAGEPMLIQQATSKPAIWSTADGGFASDPRWELQTFPSIRLMR